MTKIYEAMQFVGRIRDVSADRPVPAPVAPAALGELDEAMLALHRRIGLLLDKAPCPVVAFHGIPATADSSRFVEYYARTVFGYLNKNVLLVKIEPKTGPYQQAPCGDLAEVSRSFRPRNGADAQAKAVLVTRRMRMTDLTLAQSDARLDRIMAEWRAKYQWVVIDTTLAEAASSVEMFCAATDGVVLVAEAGMARWQAVKASVGRFTEQQAKVLGVVMNKSRHAIPAFLYRWL